MRIRNHKGDVLPSPHTPNPCKESQAAHLRRLKQAPKPKEIAAALRARIPDATGEKYGYVLPFKIDCFRIFDNPRELEQAAARLEKPYRTPSESSTPRDAVADALRLYETHANAAATIRRHLDTMGDDMDPLVRKRAEKLVGTLESKAEEEERQRLIDDMPDALKTMYENIGFLRGKLERWRLTKSESRKIHEEIDRLNTELAAMIDNEPLARALGVPFNPSPVTP